MKFRAVLFLLALTFTARAQDTDGPIKMAPEFAFTFPVVQMNKHDVSVKYPVMINALTVLKPGMVLRVIYVPPVQSDSNDLGLAHKGTMEESYSRETANTSAHQNALPRDMAHEIESQRKRVWEVPGNFVLAIAQYPTDVMHLIYSPTGNSRISDLVDTSFSFFDGMFIGSPKSDIQVLAVEKGSYADQAGIKAGDEIVSVGGTPMHSDLTQFSLAYAAAKKAAKDNEASGFNLTIRGSGGASRTASISLPPSIKNFLNGGL